MSRLEDRLLEATEHLGEVRQHEYVDDILGAVDAIRALRTILETCERDEAQGYRSSLRTYVLEIGRKSLPKAA